MPALIVLCALYWTAEQTCHASSSADPWHPPKRAKPQTQPQAAPWSLFVVAVHSADLLRVLCVCISSGIGLGW